jgi:hypothetical protein
MNGDVDSAIENIDPQKDELTIKLAEDWKAHWTGDSVINAWRMRWSVSAELGTYGKRQRKPHGRKIPLLSGRCD